MNNADLEKKLVVRCREGDRAAYEGLVKAYSGHVFAICLGMLGNSHDAEGVAQRALLKGFMDINLLRDSEQFGAWLSRIAKNLCIDFIRKQKRRRNAFAKRAATGQSSSKEYFELESALAKLPEEYRLTLALYYFDGRSAKNIAEQCSILAAKLQEEMESQSPEEPAPEPSTN